MEDNEKDDATDTGDDQKDDKKKDDLIVKVPKSRLDKLLNESKEAKKLKDSIEAAKQDEARKVLEAKGEYDKILNEERSKLSKLEREVKKSQLENLIIRKTAKKGLDLNPQFIALHASEMGETEITNDNIETIIDGFLESYPQFAGGDSKKSDKKKANKDKPGPGMGSPDSAGYNPAEGDDTGNDDLLDQFVKNHPLSKGLT